MSAVANHQVKGLLSDFHMRLERQKIHKESSEELLLKPKREFVGLLIRVSNNLRDIGSILDSQSSQPRYVSRRPSGIVRFFQF